MKEVTGSLQTKNGKYYVLVNLYDHSGKRSVKWVSLGLSVKGNKKVAKARMAGIPEEYNRSQQKMFKEVSKKKNPEQFIEQRERIQAQHLVELLTNWINGSATRLQQSTVDGYDVYSNQISSQCSLTRYSKRMVCATYATTICVTPAPVL